MTTNPILTALAVGAGGFVGSIARYLVCVRLNQPGSALPVGTLTVNVVGCFLIGMAAALVEQRHLINENGRGFLVIGVLGGLTTFSTFGNETYALLQSGRATAAVTNVVLQIALGIGAVFLGHAALSR